MNNKVTIEGIATVIKIYLSVSALAFRAVRHTSCPSTANFSSQLPNLPHCQNPHYSHPMICFPVYSQSLFFRFIKILSLCRPDSVVQPSPSSYPPHRTCPRGRKRPSAYLLHHQQRRPDSRGVLSLSTTFIWDSALSCHFSSLCQVLL